MGDLPPSSPSIALFKDGELVHFLPRYLIEGTSADADALHGMTNVAESVDAGTRAAYLARAARGSDAPARTGASSVHARRGLGGSASIEQARIPG